MSDVVASPTPAYPPVTYLWSPAHAERSRTIIWNGGRPRGLVIDGAYYAVRPSPRLRCYPGGRDQTLYEVLDRPRRP